jgi:hypothetical protein
MYRPLAALWEKGDQRLGDLAEASSFRLYLAWSENWRGGSGRAGHEHFDRCTSDVRYVPKN